MTAELVLLLSLSAFLILGVFIKPTDGFLDSFQGALPALSARIEYRVVTGHGFWSGRDNIGMIWGEPPD